MTDPAPIREVASQTRWFAEEVQPHGPMLRNYLRASFRDIRDVDDVVQESFLRVCKAHAAQPIESSKAFLFIVARRLALNVLRKTRNAPFVPSGDLAALRVLDERPSAAEAACEQETVELLAISVVSLPARCRQIIILRKLQGLSQKEVAARLRISERTVERQIQIGVKRCLNFLLDRGMTNFYGN